MVDQYIKEKILPLSNIELLDSIFSILQDDVVRIIGADNIDEFEKKLLEIIYRIPDQVKLDYLANVQENRDEYENLLISLMQDTNIIFNYFENVDLEQKKFVDALYNAITYMRDDDKRYELFIKYHDKIPRYYYRQFLETFDDDKYIIDYLTRYAPSSIDWGNINYYDRLLSTIKNDDLKMLMHDKYMALNVDSYYKYFTVTIASLKDDSKKMLYINRILSLYKENNMSGTSVNNALTKIVSSLKDDDLKLNYLNSIVENKNYKFKIDPEIIMSIQNEEKRAAFVKKHINYISINEIPEVIGSFSNQELIVELINDVINKNMVTNQTAYSLLDLVENSDIKLELFKKSFVYFGGTLKIQIDNFIENDKSYDVDSLYKKMLQLPDKDLLALCDFYHRTSALKSLEQFDKSIDLIFRIINSNSSEIRHISSQIGELIFSCPFDKWEETLDRIEDVFLKNNTPYVGKIYKVYEIMHPNYYIENPYGGSTKSPNINDLYKRGIASKYAIGALVFGDLLKCAIGSNNRSLLEYINNIEAGNAILKELISGQINITDLTGERKDIFTTYIFHLNTLYNNTKAGKENPRQMKENLVKDVYELLYCFLYEEKKGFVVDELPDRIVRLFCHHFAGINTMAELKELIAKEISEVDARNRRRAEENNFSLEKGDYYKGLVNENEDEEGRFYTFLLNILQNGSISKEFLGSDARSDTTPLDTDLSRIKTDLESFNEPFEDYSYAAARYGPLWLVLKDDDRLNYSEETGKYMPDKLEIFRTNMDGEGHYGIRTGFPSSDIDYFVVDESKLDIKRIEYSIVMNGFYIPVLNTDGKLIFTPEQYDNMRKDLYGLSHYGLGNVYEFAEELDTFDPRLEPFDINIDGNKSNSNIKRNLIINALSSVGLDISPSRNVYMKHGEIELLDTGSTGRGTNMSEDYDFDFVMRVDKEVYDNDLKMVELKNKIEEALPGIVFDGHHVRNQIININGTNIKIDISIIIKDDKIGYTTEECIKDRLSSIEKIDPEKHKKVLENIVLAKEVLKDGECYKPAHAGQGQAQGGLGGVGVENWILQNGGSFEKAARSFLEVASQCATFEEFKSRYYIFNFGENHMYYRESDKYKHNEFISGNMDASGYETMKETLSKYIIQLDERRRLEGNKIL